MEELSLNDQLRLTADEMRQMGYRTVDMIVDHLEMQSTDRVTERRDDKSLHAIKKEPLPLTEHRGMKSCNNSTNKCCRRYPMSIIRGFSPLFL